MTEFTVDTRENRIFVCGPVFLSGLRKILAGVHRLTRQRGYQDIEIDMSDCLHIEPSAALGLVVQIRKYMKDKIEFKFIPPKDFKLKQLCLNANWAHMISPYDFPENQLDKTKYNLPVCWYSDERDQQKLVDSIISAILSSASDLQRKDLRTIEWAVNEVTDNVLNHARSTIGGYVQLTSFPKRKAVQITVGDGGIGIPASLREGHPEIRTDQEALDRAIREGITRDKKAGQGNGLYGSWRVARVSKGEFFIESGYARLQSTEKLQLHAQREAIPFNGSLVSLTVKYNLTDGLEKALTFRGRQYTPTDSIELHYKEDAGGNIEFILQNEATGFGTRIAGRAVHLKLENLLRMTEGAITIDFSGINLISSSFADEVFGMLFFELGPIKFTQRFKFRNLDPLVRGLIDRSVTQRLSEQAR